MGGWLGGWMGILNATIMVETIQYITKLSSKTSKMQNKSNQLI